MKNCALHYKRRRGEQDDGWADAASNRAQASVDLALRPQWLNRARLSPRCVIVQTATRAHECRPMTLGAVIAV